MNKLYGAVACVAALCLPIFVQAQDLEWKTVTKYNKAETKKQLTDRFTKYVTFDTQSNDQTDKVPSTPGQVKLAKALAKELKKYGAKNVKIDAHAIVTGEIPSTSANDSPVVAFIAHMDTALEVSGKDVQPQVHKNYQGGDIVINAEKKLVINPANSPQLSRARGHDIITASGGTLLGADDKTGIAVIMTMVQYLYDHPELEHGLIKVAFTPDEEVGTGAGKMDVATFGADYAYTLDGDTEGEIQYENFNACSAKVIFQGVNVHPGSSKNTMINAALVAMEFDSMLPSADTPRNTADYQGFFHLCSMKGDVSQAELQYIVRDHDAASFEIRQKTLTNITEILNEKWGEGTVTLTITQQYRNMKEIIDPCPWLITLAEDACRACGVTPLILPIRGGTDGCQLSFMGLPCPNLGTGGHAFHGPYEHITAEGMDKAVDIAVELVKLYAEM